MWLAMRAPDPYIGREIEGGKYRILQKIGSGGMGAVYKAMQPKIGRPVAIKILHSKLVGRRDLVSRFSREAKALAHLTHPNTVKVFDDGVLPDGSLYIVMEFLEGRNLNQAVRAQGPMHAGRALPVLIQVCGALEEAHRRGIVHRDLKPENIFLCNQGGLEDFPKVLDFGLAKVTEREMRPGSVVLTQEGMVFGTPEFMSPEQAQGLTIDGRSDIYSLAVILYEVLTGKLPFDAKVPMEYIQLHVTQQPIPLDARCAGLTFPPGLGAALAKAMAKNPAQRYQSAAEFAASLARFTGKGPSSTAHVPRVQQAPPRQAVAGGAPAPNHHHVGRPLPLGTPRPLVPTRPGSHDRAPQRSQQPQAPTRQPGPGLLVAIAAACLFAGVVLTLAVIYALRLLAASPASPASPGSAVGALARRQGRSKSAEASETRATAAAAA
jgi:serine/threonine-protein kinase